MGNPQDSNIKSKKERQGQVQNQKADSPSLLGTHTYVSSERSGEHSTIQRRGVLWGRQVEFSAPSGPALLRTLCFLQAGCWFSSPPVLVPLFLLGPNATIYRAPGNPGMPLSHHRSKLSGGETVGFSPAGPQLPHGNTGSSCSSLPTLSALPCFPGNHPTFSTGTSWCVCVWGGGSPLLTKKDVLGAHRPHSQFTRV